MFQPRLLRSVTILRKNAACFYTQHRHKHAWATVLFDDDRLSLQRKEDSKRDQPTFLGDLKSIADLKASGLDHVKKMAKDGDSAVVDGSVAVAFQDSSGNVLSNEEADIPTHSKESPLRMLISLTEEEEECFSELTMTTEHNKKTLGLKAVSPNPAVDGTTPRGNDQGHGTVWLPTSLAVDFIERNDKKDFRQDEYNHQNQHIFDTVVSASLPNKLQSLGIVTLQDLYDSSIKTESKASLKISSCAYDWDKIKPELKIVFMKPEDKLNGKKLLLNINQKANMEMDLVEERFNKDAVSWTCKSDLEGRSERTGKISLVLGPSGSGKTMAALGELTRPQYGQKIVTVYTRSNYLHENGLEDVDQLIRSKLANVLRTDTFEDQLDMELALVVDEAAELGEWLGELSNLQKLHSDISKVATSARLIIAGTGVDQLARSISSDGPVEKYRMQAWGKANVEAILVSMGLSSREREKIMTIIAGHPILRSLSSNARAAKYLVDALLDRLSWSGTLLNVGDIVNQVAHKYIQNNVLKDLSPYERFVVAREVFKVLDKSSQTRKPHFPELDFSKGSLLAAFWGLINLNVEISGGKADFVDEQRPFSASVSGAVHVVLQSMIGSLSALGTTWSDFEVLCAQNEFQRVVMESQKADFGHNGKPPRLVTLKKPFPPPSARLQFLVPIAAEGKVFLNGVNAPFTDVIAPYRLCRCKFVSDSGAGDCALLKLNDFVNMGIASRITCTKKNAKHVDRMKISGALLSALSESWQVRDDLGTTNVTLSALQEATTDTPRQFYPAGQLVGDKSFGQQPKYKKFAYKDNETLVSTEAEYKYTDPLEKAVEVVFYTNSKSFKIEGTDVEITESDFKISMEPDTVLLEGELQESKLDALLKGLGIELRANVVLRFLFARDHNSHSSSWDPTP